MTERGARDLTGRLLIGAMLAPLVGAMRGWKIPTPLDVPVAVHLAILAAIVVAAFGPWRTHGPTTHRAVRRTLGWAPVPLAAVAFAALIAKRSNAFYTASALMEGTAVLLLLHAVVRILRALVMRGFPVAVRFSDRGTDVVGLLVVLSWILIAFSHRHVVGPLLLVAGALESLALVVLLPEAWHGWGRRLSTHAAPGADRRMERRFTYMRHRLISRARRLAHLVRRSP